MDCVVDVLRYRLVWWLVLTADSQPHIAFVPLNKPAVPIDQTGEVGEEQEGGKDNKENRGGSALHGAEEGK